MSPPKESTTTPPTYKFEIRWSQSGVVIIKGGFASFGAALAYSQRVHSFSNYGLPECEQLGIEMFRYKYHEPAHDSSLLVMDFVFVVLVGPEGMEE